MEEEVALPTVVGATVVVAIFLALGLTAADAWTSANAAAWAQAIAASLAIVAGAYGLYWQAGAQRRGESRRATADEVRRLKILFSAVVDLRARLEAHTWHEFGPFETEWSRVDEAVSLIRTVPLLDIPDWRVAFALRQAVDTYAFMRRTVPYRGQGDPQRAWSDNAYALILAASKHAKQAQQHIELVLKERKVDAPVIAAGGFVSDAE